MSLFSALPLAVLQVMGAGIGLSVYLSSAHYRRRLNKNHLSAAHYSGFKSSPWRAAIESGMIYADTLWIWGHPKASIVKTSVEHLKQIIALSKSDGGLIILATHLGGFEIVPRIFAQHMRATVMYRPSRKLWLNRLILKLRQHPQMEFVEANLSGVRKIKRALLKSEVVGILADQVPSAGDGVWAKFFNQYAYTTSFPAKLARQPNVATLFVSAERLRLGKGWLIKTRLMIESYPLCLDEACGLMNQYFEEMIISKPNQYMWSYNRYKRPHGAEVAPII